MAKMKYAEAVRAALAAELDHDDRVVILGEDIGALGGVFTATMGLQERFGADRVIDSPITEAAITGWAIGSAMLGLRLVVEIMFADFATLTMDQLVNGAAKLRYVSGGQLTVPLVVRMPADAGTHHGPQHSQHLETWFAHIPGLVVAMPATASDAYWMLRAAIQSDDPVIFVESKYLYFRQSDEVNELQSPTDGLHARIERSGRDLTVVTAGRMVHRVREAADRLASRGISCEIVDLRYISPMDTTTIAESLARTSKIAIVHEAAEFCGWGAEIAAWVAQHHLFDLDAPVARLGAAHAPIPFNSGLEDAIVPTVDRIEMMLTATAEF